MANLSQLTLVIQICRFPWKLLLKRMGADAQE